MINQCVQPLQQLDLNDPTSLSSIQGNKFKKLYCDYCHIRGHKRENCYKLVGYPPNFKNNKRMTFDRAQQIGNGNKGPLVNNVNYADNLVTPTCTTLTNRMTMPVFAPEQYQ